MAKGAHRENGWPWAGGDGLRRRHIWIACDPERFSGLNFYRAACGVSHRLVLTPSGAYAKCARCAKLEREDAIS